MLSFVMNLDGCLIDEHRAIAEAMAAGDADAAIRALKAHLGLYRTHLRKMKDAYPSYFQSTQ